MNELFVFIFRNKYRLLSHVDHPGITLTGLCIDDTISPHTLPSFEFGSLRTRSTSACRSLITTPTAAMLVATLSAHSSPFSQHWCRYFRYAPLPEITSSALHTMKSLNAAGFISCPLVWGFGFVFGHLRLWVRQGQPSFLSFCQFFSAWASWDRVLI